MINHKVNPRYDSSPAQLWCLWMVTEREKTLNQVGSIGLGNCLTILSVLKMSSEFLLTSILKSYKKIMPGECYIYDWQLEYRLTSASIFEIVLTFIWSFKNIIFICLLTNLFFWKYRGMHAYKPLHMCGDQKTRCRSLLLHHMAF